jgi:RNA recognition motif-containing protein
MTIYVGNLSFQMKDDDLKNTFSEFGNVTSAKVISDKYSGRSKGFGFVEMDNDAAGKAAIEALNGKEVQGRPLRVNEARPKEDNRER